MNLNLKNNGQEIEKSDIKTENQKNEIINQEQNQNQTKPNLRKAYPNLN